jgi:hypothetical protein
MKNKNFWFDGDGFDFEEKLDEGEDGIADLFFSS